MPVAPPWLLKVPRNPHEIRLSGNARIPFVALLGLHTPIHSNFFQKEKAPKSNDFKALLPGGISRTRTYDPHDVNVVL